MKKWEMSRISKINLAAFLSLPDRCQEIVFDYIFFRMREDENRFQIITTVISVLDECESPIEQIFLLTYLLMNADSPMFGTLSTQVEIADYRVDFLYEHEPANVRLVIECDGHEFHEKTKEQVVRNNERDFALKSMGYDVLHFSGSQIYNNPLSVVGNVREYIKTQVGEVNAEQDN